MSREEELFERKNDELRDILEEYDQPTYGNKDDLVSRILHFELGVPEDEAEATSDEPEAEAATVESQPEENGEAAANDADDEGTPPEDTESAVESDGEDARPATSDESTEESAEDEGEQVLVRFLGTSSLHEARGHRFSVEHPFGVLSKEDAEALTRERPRLFRFARPAEADSYYS